MSRVMIVARTLMNDHMICLAGIDLDAKRFVRLLDQHGRYYAPDAVFEIGQLWEMQIVQATNLVLPHSEDVKIIKAALIVDSHPSVLNKESLVATGLVHDCDPDGLFYGKLEWIQGQGAFASAVIANQSDPGAHSLALWQTDRPFYPVDAREQRRVPYFATKLGEQSAIWRLPYTGTSSIPRQIPQGSIVSLSLARWWDRGGTAPRRCYLQMCNLLV